MIDNYEVLIKKKDKGWVLIFNQGTTHKQVDIETITEIKQYLKKWLVENDGQCTQD